MVLAYLSSKCIGCWDMVRQRLKRHGNVEKNMSSWINVTFCLMVPAGLADDLCAAGGRGQGGGWDSRHQRAQRAPSVLNCSTITAMPIMIKIQLKKM